MKRILITLSLPLLLLILVLANVSCSSSPEITPCKAIDTTQNTTQNTVIALCHSTGFGLTTTRIMFNDGSSLKLNGDIDLLIGATYQFSFYDNSWHIDKLLFNSGVYQSE